MASGYEKLKKTWTSSFLKALVADPFVKSARARLAPLEIVALEVDGRSTGVDLADLLARDKALLLVGESGSGKSTLLWSVAYDYAYYALNFGKGDISQCALCEELAIPVYIDAAETVSESFEGLVVRWFQRYLGDDQIDSIPSFLGNDGGFIFLIDNLDNLFLDKRFTEFQSVIRFMTERFPQHHYVLAVGAQHLASLKVLLPPLRISCIKPLSQESILRHLSSRFSEQEVDKIAQNLTSLRLWAVVNNTRSLESAAWIFLEEDWDANPTLARLLGKLLPLLVGSDVLNYWQVLAELALQMTREGTLSMGQSRFAKFIREREQNLAVRRDPIDMFIASGLIGARNETGEYYFSHQVYRDYLAAAALHKIYKDGATLASLVPADSEPWAEVLSLFYGMVEDRHGMLRELLSANADPQHIRIAVKCALENERKTDLRRSLQVSFFDPNLHFMLGKALKDFGCYDEARLEFEESIKLKPDRANMRFELAEVFAAMGKTNLAMREYKNALDLSPGDIAWQVKMALVSTGRKDEAKITGDLLALADKLASRQSEIYVYLSCISLQNGKDEEAKSYASFAVELCASAANLTHHGEMLRQLKGKEQAKESFGKAIGVDAKYAPAYVGLGLVLEEDGLFSDALNNFKHALELLPENAEIHLHVGRLYRLAAEVSLSELHLRRALRLRPGLPAAQAELALLFESQGKLTEAVESVRVAVDADHTNASYHHLLGRFLRSLGRLQEAESELRHALSLEKDNPEWHNELGTVLGELGRNEHSLREYRRASELMPSNPLYRRNIGVALVQLGEDESALAAFRLALGLCQEQRESERETGGALLWTLVAADVSSEIGQIFERRGEHRSALEHYQKARELMPGLPSYRVQEGIAYGRFNQHDRMLKILQKAVEMDPGDAIAHSQLGEAYESLGRVEDALAEYSKAANLQPEEASFSRNKGRTLQKLGMTSDSIDSLKRATELQHQDIESHIQLALAYETSDRIEDAITEARHAARLDVNNALAWLTLGRCSRKLRRAGEALTSLKRALALNPADFRIHVEIAECYLQQAKFKDALKSADEAIACSSSEAYCYHLASRSAKGLDDLLLAAGNLEKALSLEPDNAEWQFELAEIYSEAGNTGSALERYVTSIELQPTSAKYHRHFARFLQRIGDGEKAFGELQAAVKCNPNDADMRFELAKMLAEKGELEPALHQCLAALEEGPIRPEHHWLAGNLLFKLGRNGSAMAHLEKAVALNGEQPEWFRQLGLIYLKINQFTLAIHSFLRSLSLQDTAQIHRDLAMAYAQAGQLKECVNQLRIALHHPSVTEGKISSQERIQWSLELGDACKEMRQLDGALEAYQAALELAGESAALREKIGIILSLQGKDSEAMSELQKASELGEAGADLSYFLAKSLLGAGHLDAALFHANKAVQSEATEPEFHMLIAAILKKKGEFGSAVRYVSRALQLKSDDASTYDEMAVLYEKVGQSEMALPAYQKAIELEPRNTDYMLHLGRLLLSRRNTVEAIPYLTSAVANSPVSAEAHFLLGWALEEQGKTQEALREYRRSVELQKDRAECLYRLGRLIGQGGDLDNSIALLEAATKIEPDHASWHVELGAMYEGTGAIQNAITQLRVAQENDPGSNDVNFRLGSLLLKAGQKQEAVLFLEKACRVEPVPAGWLNELGKCRYALNQMAEARNLFERASSLSPVEDEYKIRIAATLRHLGMIPDSINRLKAITRVKPNLAEAHYELGLSLREQKQGNDALSSIQTALRLSPENHQFRLSLAETLGTFSRDSEALLQIKNLLEDKGTPAWISHQAGRLAESKGQDDLALACYNRALSNQRDNSFLVDCSRMLARLGKHDQAIALLKEAISRDGSRSEWYSILGEILEEQGDYSEAISCHEKAVELTPDEALYHRNLGVTYEMLGKYERAKESLQTALKLKPDYADAFRHLTAVSAKQTMERGMGRTDLSH